MLIVLLIGVIVFLLFQKRPVYKAGRLQTIEHVIHGKDSIIVKWKTKIVENKSKVNGLNSQIERLKDSLTVSKELKDTVTIIDTQDTLIKSLELNLKFYDDLVKSCDSVISNQNEKIELQDSLIFIQRTEIKDLKKDVKKGKFFNRVGEIATGIVGIVSGIKIYQKLK